MTVKSDSGPAPGVQRPPLIAYSAKPEDLVGRVLDERYIVEGILGKGAMGLVLGARHAFLDKRVAVKILHPSLVLVDEMKERFLREARAASIVHHDGLVAVSDFGVTDAGLYYLVMEYLEGQDLYEWTGAQGVIPIPVVASIALQICDALTALHDAGFVHRDLKPENIWVMKDPGPEGLPRVKVLDLGIAAVMEDRGEGQRLTKTGHTVGTVHYMSPEQALGERVDGRTDIYALGCLMWELVAGECTFEGSSHMAVMMKHMSEEPQRPSTRRDDVPPWLDEVVMRCLRKQADDRFQSSRELQRAIESGLELGAVPLAATGGGRSVARFAETGHAPTTETRSSVRPRRVGLVVTIAALLAVSVGLWLLAGPSGTSDVPVVVDPRPAAPEVAPGAPLDPPLAEQPGAAAVVAPPAPGEGASAELPVDPGAQGEAPPVAPAPKPKPARVTLHFQVTPVGTTVERDGRPIGFTPLTLEVPREDRVVSYRFVHDGSVPLVVKLSHGESQTVSDALADAPVVKAPVRRAPVAKDPPSGLMLPEKPK